MILKAKAKVNLYLQILRKDTNNYHHLQSLVCFADDAYDEIELSVSEELCHDVSFYGEFASQVDNPYLVLKLLKLLPIKYFYKIKIKKNIPVGAGLGGGSADIAAILKYLIQQENIILTNKQLQDICLSLGADVYCCYYSKISNISRYGEIVSAVKFPLCLHALLISPRIKLNTEDIFSKFAFKYSDQQNNDMLASFANYNELIDFIKLKNNDLQPVAAQLVTQIPDIISILNKETNAEISRMTGSGSSCFAIYNNKEDCLAAFDILQKKNPNFWMRYSSLS